MGREYYYCLSLSCLAQVQSSSIYDDLPIGYTLKGRTMSSLRNDSKQHRSITAPFWKNKKKQARQQNCCQFYMRKKLQSESDFCDVTSVCHDGDIGTHKFMISSCFG